MKELIVNRVGKDIIENQTAYSQLQSELKEREDRLNLSLKATGSGTYDWYPSTGMSSWDVQMRNLFGLALDSTEDPNEYFFRVVHPDDLDRIQQDFIKMLDSSNKELNIEDEYRIIKNGEVRYIKTNGFIFRMENGEVQRIIGTCRDITEARNKEILLSSTTEKLNEAQRLAKIGAFETELETRKIWWSQGMFDIFEVDPDQGAPDGIEFLSIVHPKDREHIINEIARCIKQKTKIKFQYRLLFPDGRIKHMDDMATPIVNSEGWVIKINGTSQDVSERVLSDAALKRSEEQYRTLVENSHDLIWEVDRDGNFTFINSKAKEIYGYEPAEMIGVNFTKFMAPDSLKETMQLFEDTLQNGINVFHYESKVHNKNGEIVILDSHTVVKRNEAGEIQSVMGTSQNITDRKLVEQALRKSEERLQISTKAAAVGIWDWNIESDILIWDETMNDLYGLSQTELVIDSSFWESKVHPGDRDFCEQIINKAIKTGDQFSMEYRIIWPDDTIRYIKEVGAIHRDNKGKAIRMFGTNWDITKEKEAEEQEIRARQLEVRNQELEQFAYVASHDLKEPLRTVKSFAELLKQRYENRLDQDADKYLGFISQAASRMDKVIKALLDYSRIGRKSELTEINCQSLVNNILRDLSVMIRDANVQFEIDKLPVVNGYAMELRMLFQNLVSNAIKFRHHDRELLIDLTFKQKEKHWEFCIADNGIGIKSTYHQKIFALFQRLHSRSEFEGTGIGLAHCKKIMELHQGDIWVESREGEGSAFYFTVPY